MAQNLKRCPFGCGRLIPEYWIACSACHYAVPKPLRGRLYHLFREYRAGFIGRDDYERYIEQLTAAVETPW
jgi:predicted DCC family thiol-disulfide oxidoreductase YuxK